MYKRKRRKKLKNIAVILIILSLTVLNIPISQPVDINIQRYVMLYSKKAIAENHIEYLPTYLQIKKQQEIDSGNIFDTYRAIALHLSPIVVRHGVSDNAIVVGENVKTATYVTPSIGIFVITGIDSMTPSISFSSTVSLSKLFKTSATLPTSADILQKIMSYNTSSISLTVDNKSLKQYLMKQRHGDFIYAYNPDIWAYIYRGTIIGDILTSIQGKKMFLNKHSVVNLQYSNVSASSTLTDTVYLYTQQNYQNYRKKEQEFRKQLQTRAQKCVLHPNLDECKQQYIRKPTTNLDEFMAIFYQYYSQALPADLAMRLKNMSNLLSEEFQYNQSMYPDNQQIDWLSLIRNKSVSVAQSLVPSGTITYVLSKDFYVQLPIYAITVSSGSGELDDENNVNKLVMFIVGDKVSLLDIINYLMQMYYIRYQFFENAVETNTMNSVIDNFDTQSLILMTAIYYELHNKIPDNAQLQKILKQVAFATFGYYPTDKELIQWLGQFIVPLGVGLSDDILIVSKHVPYSNELKKSNPYLAQLLQYDYLLLPSNVPKTLNSLLVYLINASTYPYFDFAAYMRDYIKYNVKQEWKNEIIPKSSEGH